MPSANAWQPVDDVGFAGSNGDLSNITNFNPGGALSAIEDIQHLKMDGGNPGTSEKKA